MPPRGSKVDRLSEAERKIDALQRQLARLEARPASVPSGRRGRMIGKLDGTLTAGGTQTVDGEWWDGAAVATKDVSITARDFFLPTGKTLPDEAKVIAEFMDDAEWWITQYVSEVAAILFGLTTASHLHTADTFNVDNVVALSPVGGVAPTTITGVENILHFPSAENDEVLIFRKGETETYYGIPHPSRTDCT